jgi:hypothetical protein
MLRFDHLPSDFHPLFLFLGDREDLAVLAALLRSFDFGLKPDNQNGFRWGLNAWQAEQIAERIEALTPPDQKSGSDIIELGVDGEIPVKVSRGEFTDDFLVRRF